MDKEAYLLRVDGKDYTFGEFQSLPKAKRDELLGAIPNDERLSIARDYMARFIEVSERLIREGYKLRNFDPKEETVDILSPNNCLVGYINHDLTVSML